MSGFPTGGLGGLAGGEGSGGAGDEGGRSRFGEDLAVAQKRVPGYPKWHLGIWRQDQDLRAEKSHTHVTLKRVTLLPTLTWQLTGP